MGGVKEEASVEPQHLRKRCILHIENSLGFVSSTATINQQLIGGTPASSEAAPPASSEATPPVSGYKEGISACEPLDTSSSQPVASGSSPPPPPPPPQQAAIGELANPSPPPQSDPDDLFNGRALSASQECTDTKPPSHNDLQESRNLMIEFAPGKASALSFSPTSHRPPLTAHEDLKQPDPQPETQGMAQECTEECNAEPLSYTAPPLLSWNLSEAHLSSLNPVPTAEGTSQLIMGLSSTTAKALPPAMAG